MGEDFTSVESGTPADADSYTALSAAQQRSRKRSLTGLIALIAGLVLIVLIILLLSTCAGAGRGTANSKRPVIKSVAGMQPISGAVSLWIEPGTSVKAVLSRGGVTAADYIDMGGNRYVLQVAAGAEKTVADKLAVTKGAYDAGLVYEQAGSSD